MALAMRTAIITGRMCVICPVSSKTITEVEIVCVTAPAIAAAPVTIASHEQLCVYVCVCVHVCVCMRVCAMKTVWLANLQRRSLQG